MGDQAVGVGGIDVANDWHYVQWLDPNGRPVGKALWFANTRAGFEAMGAQRTTLAVMRRQHHQNSCDGDRVLPAGNTSTFQYSAPCLRRGMGRRR